MVRGGAETDREVLEHYNAAYEAEKADLNEYLRFDFGDLDFVQFYSCSAGRGRRRKPRLVTFFKAKKTVWTIREDGGEPIVPRDPNKTGLDRIAQERLIHLPEEERTTDALLELGINVTRWKRRQIGI